MIFSCNRFAIIPHMCNECKRYVWIEPLDLLDKHANEVTLDDNDCFGYHEVGWNMLDLDALFEALNEKNLRIPNPKLRFEPHYT